MKKVKSLVLFSGGLDSRLAIKLLQEQGLKVEALYVKLPFGTGCCSSFECSFNFTQIQGVKLNVLDASNGKLFKEYLGILKKPKHGRGKGFNPCKDCKIFLFRQAKKFAKKINAEIIATGEVLGQRSFSQMKKQLMLDEEEAELKNKILRPLSAKLLPETTYEKKGLVDREMLLGIQGRTRTTQIALAKKYKIKYPTPAGGCLLCEKHLKNRFKILVKGDYLNEKNVVLSSIGRHFLIKNSWIVLGRNEKENEILKNVEGGKLFVPEFPGPSAIVMGKINDEKIWSLIKAYSKNGSLENKKSFNKFLV
ncbi:MAG: hypothetical protein KC516_04045 [Nanoarchaeota archaeon]|nr:hypothetical protein [Nanoarchaeota archaeon]